jgi:hypothetical protein
MPNPSDFGETLKTSSDGAILMPITVGGPDDGKRITLLPWRSQQSLEDIAEKVTVGEVKALGYSARPAIYCHGTFHISTIMYVRGILHEQRGYEMAHELEKLYTQIYSQLNRRSTDTDHEDASKQPLPNV